MEKKQSPVGTKWVSRFLSKLSLMTAEYRFHLQANVFKPFKVLFLSNKRHSATTAAE